MSPTKDEFHLWQDHPVTRWVIKAVKAHAEAQKAAWLVSSWDKGAADPLLLCELRTRSDAYAALYEATYQAWCELNGDEPRDDP